MTELPPLIPPPGALPRITPRDRLNGTPAPGVTLGARAEALRGEHESAAAVKVQAMARGRNARKYQVQESSAAAKLQAVQRGKSARNGVRDYEAWCAREAAREESNTLDSAGDDAGDMAVVKPSRSTAGRLPLLSLFGLRGDRAFWGFRPCDLGARLSSTEEWFEPVPGGHNDHESEHHEEHRVQHGHAKATLFSTMTHHVPVVRHLWGDPQYELHPDAQELFLDLIFVGVAFEVGRIMKYSYFSCAYASSMGSGSGSGGGSGSSSYTASSASVSASGSVVPGNFNSGSMSGSASGTSMSYSSSGSSALRRELAAAASGSGPTVLCLGDEMVNGSNELIALGLGVVHALAPFMCMYLLWNIETHYRARYAASGKVHSCLDKVGTALLLLASLFMEPVNSGLREEGLGPNGTLLSFLILDLCLWMARTAEVAILSTREAARRESSAELVAYAQVLAMWVIALVILWSSPSDVGWLSESAALNVAAALMWASNIWLFLRRGFRALGALVLPGPHLPLERQMVTANINFIYHRNNEFMFLMLGETVLQIVIASHERNGDDDDRTRGTRSFPAVLVSPTIITALSGFLVALTLMFAFKSIVAGQHHAAHHINAEIEQQQQNEARLMGAMTAARGAEGSWSVQKIAGKADAVAKLSTKFDSAHAMYTEAQRLLLKIRATNVFADFLWQINAMAVMLTGVAIKLVLYSPTGNASPHSIIATRLIICCPIVLCFTVQLTHCVVLKNRHHYTLSTMKEQTGHTLVLSVRVAMLILQISLTWIISTDRENVEIATPYRFLGVQSVLCLVQALLLEVQEHKLKIHSNRPHPLARVPQALHTLRLRSAQARLRAHASSNNLMGEGGRTRPQADDQ